MTPIERRHIHEHMVRFADGDRSAFRSVFHGLWPVLVGFGRGMHLDQADAEDAAQQGVLKIFAQIADLDRSRDAVAWALTITAFEVMTVRKRRARRREGDLGAALECPDPHPGPDEHAVARDLERAIRDAVGDLDTRDQEALREVLADVGAARGETARKRRYRALQRLRDLWWRFHG